MLPRESSIQNCMYNVPIWQGNHQANLPVERKGTWRESHQNVSRDSAVVGSFSSSFYFSECVTFSFMGKTPMFVYLKDSHPRTDKVNHGSNIVTGKPFRHWDSGEKESLGPMLLSSSESVVTYLRVFQSLAHPQLTSPQLLALPVDTSLEWALRLCSWGQRLTVSSSSLCPQGQKQCLVCGKNTVRVG